MESHIQAIELCVNDPMTKVQNLKSMVGGPRSTLSEVLFSRFWTSGSRFKNFYIEFKSPGLNTDTIKSLNSP